MDLIEQYIQAVASYLPGSLKNKARKIIRHQIEEGLPEDYTEMDIHGELQKLGSPQDFARVFRTNQFLIGPNYYPQYLALLQRILPILYVAMLLVNGAHLFLTDEIPHLGKYMLNHLLLRPLNGGIQVVLAITVLFVLLEKNNVPMPESILIIPKPKTAKKPVPKITKLGVNAFLTLAVIFLMQFFSQIIAIYPQGAGSIPIFDQERLRLYLPFIFLLGAMQLAFIFLEITVAQPGRKMAIANVAYNAAIVTFLTFFLTDRLLYTAGFLNWVGNQTYWFIIPFLSLAFALCVCDSIKKFKN
ncbi:MAG: hypothetical protein FWF59_09310 [Turicibacter sp.]|nr:hypothetical protein [Turicibacter sp.]